VEWPRNTPTITVRSYPRQGTFVRAEDEHWLDPAALYHFPGDAVVGAAFDLWLESADLESADALQAVYESWRAVYPDAF
jgi:hypothetical protein